jgi:secondary thiamine-phosphate synthase enzyme
MDKITVKTQKKNDLIDITSEVKGIVESLNIQDGICVVFCPHTTSSITINEAFDPSVKGDIIFSFNKISPNYKEFRHTEGNSDAHVKSSVMGSSINLIINKGKIMLGQWQGIYFTEFDGPRTREIWIQVISK